MPASKKIRSRPVYVETVRGTISLVFEANADDIMEGASGSRPAILGKTDVYIINSEGVHKARRTNLSVPRTLFAIALAFLLWASCLIFLRALKEGRWR